MPIQNRVPAVPIDKSISEDLSTLVCLEDGVETMMFKRHLRVVHGLTPDEYRERWDLPEDYPMVAPLHAARKQIVQIYEDGRSRSPSVTDGSAA